MDVGQVSFHDQRKASVFPSLLSLPQSKPENMALDNLTAKLLKQVKRILVPNRENPIVNRLNKTKVEKKPDLKAEKDEMLKQLRAKEQAALQIKVRASTFQKLLP